MILKATKLHFFIIKINISEMIEFKSYLIKKNNHKKIAPSYGVDDTHAWCYDCETENTDIVIIIHCNCQWLLCCVFISFCWHYEYIHIYICHVIISLGYINYLHTLYKIIPQPFRNIQTSLDRNMSVTSIIPQYRLFFIIITIYWFINVVDECCSPAYQPSMNL